MKKQTWMILVTIVALFLGFWAGLAWHTSWYPIPPMSITLEGSTLPLEWIIAGGILVTALILIRRNKKRRIWG